MPTRRLKTVFSAEPRQIERIRLLVRARRYKSPSEFLRAAIDDKLAALDRAALDQQVATYCAEGFADEDRDLLEAQAPGEEP